jgi:hypothetical protein
MKDTDQELGGSQFTEIQAIKTKAEADSNKHECMKVIYPLM